MPSSENRETRFCIATPLGRGAVATISICGWDCMEVIRQLFKPARNRKIFDADFGTMLYGNWQTNSEHEEDLVVSLLDENRVDVHCHGGEQSIRLISKSLIGLGVTQIDDSQFAEFVLNNRYFADIQIAITRAPTTRSARMLFDQPFWHKKFLRKMASYVQNHKKQSGCRLIEQVLQWQDFGTRITNGWTLAFCGEPNVGKSSLTNAILGYDRAIVHSTQGTTRDSVESITSISGWPIRLIDTAGIRETDDEVEQQGISLARQKAADADLVVLVVDSTQLDDGRTEQQIADLHPDLVVANKSDLSAIDNPLCTLSVSAKTGAGIDQLIDAIGKQIAHETVPVDQAFPVSVFQVTLLSTLRQYLESYYWQAADNLVSELLQTGEATEFI